MDTGVEFSAYLGTSTSLRNDATFETKFSSLAHAQPQAANGAQFTGKAYLTDECRLGRNTFFAIARGDRDCYPQVDGWFLQSKTADDVCINIMVAYGQPYSFGQHGKQHKNTIVLDTVGGAACNAKVTRCDQCLHLYQ